MRFKFNNKEYRAKGYIVETDFGPENRVEIRDERSEQIVATYQECASTSLIVEWWKDSMREVYPCDACAHAHACDNPCDLLNK